MVATLTITTQGSNYQLHTTSLETITNNSKKTVSEAEKIATKLASQTFQVTKKQKKNLPIVVIDYDSTDKMQHNLLDQERQDQEHQDQEQEHRITRDVGDTSVTQTQNETCERFNEISEKVDQLMIPENSYWKNLASKTCKTQLSILGIYPEASAFQKAFETILEQEKPGYIEKHGPQWIHIYSGRIEPLCRDIIKSR
ncbi:unnamed protein product [Rhizophagus irregularis]|nr:unnamed protein product [Rhizophagus irregularis]